MEFKNLKLSKKTTFTIWVVIIALVIAAPTILPVFRLNPLGRYLSLAIVALGVDLIWGFTGLLSLGQGIFFFSSRRRHTRCSGVSWARRCV